MAKQLNKPVREISEDEFDPDAKEVYADGSEDPVTDTDRDEDERTDRDFPGYV